MLRKRLSLLLSKKQVIMLPTRDDLLHHDSLEGSRDFWSLTLPKGIKIIRRSSIHRKVGRKQLVGFVLSFGKKALKPLQKNIKTHTRR